jgi:hypothetical protein
LLTVIGYSIYGRLFINLTIQSFEFVQGQGGIIEELMLKMKMKEKKKEI